MYFLVHGWLRLLQALPAASNQPEQRRTAMTLRSPVLTLNGLLGGAEAQAHVLVPPLAALAHNLLHRLVVAAAQAGGMGGARSAAAAASRRRKRTGEGSSSEGRRLFSILGSWACCLVAPAGRRCPRRAGMPRWSS